MSKIVKPKSHALLIEDTDVLRADQLTEDQAWVVEDIKKWIKTKKKKREQVKRYGGLGGTGKSALIRFLIQELDLNSENCWIVAYTGQAVNVLRQSGILAYTINSRFTHAIDIPLKKDGKIIRHRGIPITTTKWVPIKSIPSEVELIIIDEASFVSTDMEDMIKGYDCPIIEFGDPLQLPPVTGKPCFRMDNIDYLMKQVMRQNMDSEIYRLSIALRNGEAIDPAEYTKDVRFLYAMPTPEETFMRYRPFFKNAGLIVSTSNKQRDIITRLYRETFIGTKTPFPKKGEKLICRQNNWNLMIGDYPLTNGTTGYAMNTVAGSLVSSKDGGYFLDFRPSFIDNDFYDNLFCDADFLTEPFGQGKKKPYYTPGEKFEYGYVLTAHISQGAQADTVLFMDNWNQDPEYHMRIRYTAETRAKKKLYYILPYSKYGKWTDLKTPRPLSGVIK